MYGLPVDGRHTCVRNAGIYLYAINANPSFITHLFNVCRQQSLGAIVCTGIELLGKGNLQKAKFQLYSLAFLPNIDFAKQILQKKVHTKKNFLDFHNETCILKVWVNNR